MKDSDLVVDELATFDSEPRVEFVPDRGLMLTDEQVCKRLSWSRATLWRRRKDGSFPHAMALGPGIRRTPLDVVTAYMDGLAPAASGAAPSETAVASRNIALRKWALEQAIEVRKAGGHARDGSTRIQVMADEILAWVCGEESA